ncbi:hypothetical protein GCM10010411_76560 [Actinomadura fulvescens]|uniref:Uncharacterized protein n=1 Tax=Actinomadura fulvescens TaxID=46160 RepID=A0ABN3QJ99_9ACTN
MESQIIQRSTFSLIVEELAVRGVEWTTEQAPDGRSLWKIDGRLYSNGELADTFGPTWWADNWHRLCTPMWGAITTPTEFTVREVTFHLASAAREDALAWTVARCASAGDGEPEPVALVRRIPPQYPETIEGRYIVEPLRRTTNSTAFTTYAELDKALPHIADQLGLT